MIIKFKHVISVSALAFLVACGGGGNDVALNEDVKEIGQSQLNSGGSEANPTLISYSKDNVIDKNSLKNYFKLSAQAGDTLFIKASLNNSLGRDWSSYCYFASSPGRMGAGLLLGTSAASCSEYLRHTFNKPGEYLLRADYSNNISGIISFGSFKASLVPANKPLAVSLSATGTPDQPKLISIKNQNAISPDDFLNNYAINLKKGQTIKMAAIIDAVIDRDHQSNCYTSKGSFNEGKSYGIDMNGAGFSCGTSFEHKAEYDGVYYFNFRYPGILKSHFNAEVF